MNPLRTLRRLGRQLFSSRTTGPQPKPKKRRPVDSSKLSVSEPPPPPPKPLSKGRGPFFVQIGFDFGTAFSKCVCRDIMIDKAWIYTPAHTASKELPFLIPCCLAYSNRFLSLPLQSNGGYIAGGLPHVKMALEKVALKKWNDPVLSPFKDVSNETELTDFVKACAVYLIAGILGGVKRDIINRFPGHQQGDYTAVNMALPVADANEPDVKTLFQEVLCLAWVLADNLIDHPKLRVQDILSLMTLHQTEAEQEEVREACYLYPEVSANVQGFVRSKVSSPGIYLFSDTGAGTVDQSLFIFSRRAGNEKLAYLHAEVLPLGSGHIERLALDHARENGLENLEKWRLLKEAGEENMSLFLACHQIGNELGLKTRQTIARAKQKLNVRSQINQLKIIFGGGGHCRVPYTQSVIEQFSSDIFPIGEIRERKQMGDPLHLGMPLPRDLESEGMKPDWMKRLSVAYGLAFEKSQLASFILPQDVATPQPEEIWNPRALVFQAPTKDAC